MIVDTEYNAQVAHEATVKAMRKQVWRELVGNSRGEADDAVSAIRSGFHPAGETNAKLMQEGKELEGLLVPLPEPKEMHRLPEALRPLL
jgi:hypothetical protein